MLLAPSQYPEEESMFRYGTSLLQMSLVGVKAVIQQNILAVRELFALSLFALQLMYCANGSIYLLALHV